MHICIYFHSRFRPSPNFSRRFIFHAVLSIRKEKRERLRIPDVFICMIYLALFTAVGNAQYRLTITNNILYIITLNGEINTIVT